MNHAGKTVTIHGADYLVGLLSAFDGNWILGRWTEKWGEGRAAAAAAAAHSAPQPDGGAQVPPKAARGPERDEAMLAMASFLIPKLTRDELRVVQDICLCSCSRFEEVNGRQVAMPIMAGPGVFAVAELERNAPVVLELMRQSIAFNIAPFFPDPGSSSAR